MRSEPCAGVLVLLLGVAACADAPDLVQPEPTRLADTKPPTPFIVKHVSASGTGCPPGSWTATPTRAPSSILRPEESGDPVLRLAFTSYSVALNAQRLHATLDCHVAIELDAQKDISFTPRQLQPSAFTDRLRVDLGWMGDPASAQSIALDGSAAVALRDAHWSTCGGLQTLEVATVLDADHRNWDRTISLNRLDITLLPRRCPKPEVDAGLGATEEATTDAAVGPALDGGATDADQDVVSAKGLTLDELSLNPSCPWNRKFELAAQGDHMALFFEGFTLPQAQSFTPTSELCWFKLIGRLPQGYEVAVGSFAVQGIAALPVGASLALAGGAVVRNNLGGELMVPADAQRHVVPGPFEGAIATAQTFHGPDLRFSGCNRKMIPFALSAEVLGSPLPTDGSVKLDRVDLSFVMRPCKD